MMELLGIEKIASGAYLNYYNLLYKNRVGKLKKYEIISRDKDIQDNKALSDSEPQAVVLMVLNKDHTKILLNEEFRMAVNSYVYNMPAGIIEVGESYQEAGSRELEEETGLDLIRIIDILPPTFSAVGISNEKTVMIVCEAEGEFGGHPEVDEEINPKWFTKDEIKEILKDVNHEKYHPMAARTQMFCYMWINSNF